MATFKIPNPEACGLGEGSRCCSYLVVGPDGFICGRDSLSSNPELLDRMNAKRRPILEYPLCQSEE